MGSMVHNGFQAIPGTDPTQVQSAYNQAQQGVGQSYALQNGLQLQGGLQNQSNVFSQLQGVANGTGPNPALAQLQQATGQNVANQAALMAGQRGAGANAGLIAREAAQQGANTQQQAAGQAAILQAQQRLGALNQMGGIANQQAAQLLQGTQNYNQAAQGLQQNLLGTLGQQNQINAGVAQGNTQNNTGLLGGALNAAGAIGSTIFAARGGVVPDEAKVSTKIYDQVRMARPKDPHLAAVADIYHSHRYADGGEVEPQQKLSWYGGGDDERAQRAAQMQAGFMKSAQDNPVSKAIAWLTGSGQQQQQNGHGYAKGGKVDAMVSPGEVYLSPKEVKKVAKEGKSPLGEGEKVSGKPKVPGDSYANDTVPKKLEAGGIVIPNSVLQSADPEGEAAKFVKKLLGQKKEHGHFQKALKQAIASRKS